MTQGERLERHAIFLFWLPLAATWLMMALEGPFLAAVIARLAEPKFNLAAYGVAFAFAILVESPVIMIMSASTALVDDAESFRKLRNFTYALNAAITLIMLVVLVPVVFRFIALDLVGLPVEVARLTHVALAILLPWPAAIGYRRFYQGLLIRNNLTRRVAYGTIVRLLTMATTALILYRFFDLPGAYVGAAALASGVCAEALASRVMVDQTLRELLQRPAEVAEGEETLTYGRIAQFYYPLALTSILSFAVQPMVTFLMGRARDPVESLAVLPVVNSLSFVFRSVGLSYQEVAIALLGRNREHFRELSEFALLLGIGSSLGLFVIAYTSLANFWFHDISGLSLELTRFAIPPTRVVAVLPALSVLLSLQRAILVQGRATSPITWATLAEVAGILMALMALTRGLDMVGATAAAIAFVIGRAGGNTYLLPPFLAIIRRSTSTQDTSLPKEVRRRGEQGEAGRR